MNIKQDIGENKSEEIDLLQFINIFLSRWKMIVIGSLVPTFIYFIYGVFTFQYGYSSQYLYRVPNLKPSEYQLLIETIFSDDLIPNISKKLSSYLGRDYEDIVATLKNINTVDSIILIDTIPHFNENKPQETYNMLKIRINSRKLDDYMVLKQDIENEFLFPAFESQATKNKMADLMLRLQNEEILFAENKTNLTYQVVQSDELLKQLKKIKIQYGGGFKVQIPTTVLNMNTVEDQEADDMSLFLPLDQQIMAQEVKKISTQVSLENEDSKHKGRIYLINNLDRMINKGVDSETEALNYFKSIEIPEVNNPRNYEYKFLENFVKSTLPSWRYDYIRVNNLPTIQRLPRGLGKKTALFFLTLLFLFMMVAFILEFIKRNKGKFKISDQGTEI